MFFPFHERNFEKRDRRAKRNKRDNPVLDVTAVSQIGVKDEPPLHKNFTSKFDVESAWSRPAGCRLSVELSMGIVTTLISVTYGSGTCTEYIFALNLVVSRCYFKKL